MENPFPLEIENKEDSWELEQLLMGVQSRFKLPAQEFNKIRAALEFLYTQLMITEGGLPSNILGNIPSQEYIVNAIDWSGELQEYARIWNAVNASTTIFLVRSNQTLYFRTKRIVFDTVNPNDYTVIVRRWREMRKYSNESAVVSIGGNSQITLSPTTSRLALEHEERYSVVDGEIVNGFTQPLGDVTDIAQSVNSLGVDLFPQQDEILFTDDDNNFWIYQGQSEVIGQAGTTVPTDFLEFIEDNIQVDDEGQGNVSSTIFVTNKNLEGVVGETLEDKIVTYINGLKLNKTTDTADLWVDYREVTNVFSSEFTSEFA